MSSGEEVRTRPEEINGRSTLPCCFCGGDARPAGGRNALGRPGGLVVEFEG